MKKKKKTNKQIKYHTWGCVLMQTNLIKQIKYSNVTTACLETN